MWITSSSGANGCNDGLSSHALSLSARWINHCRGWQRGFRHTLRSKGYRLNLTLIVNLGLAQWTEESLSAPSDFTPKLARQPAAWLDNKRPRAGGTKMAADATACQVSIFGWFITATACLGNMIILLVPHWSRRIGLTRLKLIGPGLKRD